MIRVAVFLLLCLSVVAASAVARAQASADAWNPRTGDAWIDAALADINRYGERYPDAFVDELVRYYGAPRQFVSGLLEAEGWLPGDVYYACAVGRAVGRSCRYVAEARNRDPDAGWGELARRLGVEPGSEAFERLEQGFAPTYERWARPLPPH